MKIKFYFGQEVNWSLEINDQSIKRWAGIEEKRIISHPVKRIYGVSFGDNILLSFFTFSDRKIKYEQVKK